MELMRKFNVATPSGKVAHTPEEAELIASSMKDDIVIKAQVLSGGRGKGTFAKGFKGGVHVCTSPHDAKAIAGKMIGDRLITKQSGAEGKPCNKVLVTERVYARNEAYFAILMDRKTGGPCLIASSEGGVEIEEVAATNPSAIVTEPVNLKTGVKDEQLERLAKAVGFKPTKEIIQQTKKIFAGLYDLFIKNDCTLVEINPLAETNDGRVLCLDAKLNFDDNADFRHKDIFALNDDSQEDPREVQAKEYGLNYIGLDGNIGCLVNGAGLAMATMDVIKLSGGAPANFLDIGGGANEKQVTQAFTLLDSDPQVKAILVNIFGGIMRCDVIAQGIINAASEIGLEKPLIVRLEGTNVEAAKKLIAGSSLKIITAGDLGEAAKKAVAVAEIVDQAQAASLKVTLQN